MFKQLSQLFEQVQWHDEAEQLWERVERHNLQSEIDNPDSALQTERTSIKEIEKIIQEGKKKGYVCNKLHNLWLRFESFQDEICSSLLNTEIIVDLNVFMKLLEKVMMMPVAIPVQAKLQQKIKEVKLLETECARITQILMDDDCVQIKTIQETVDLLKVVNSTFVTTNIIDQFSQVGGAINQWLADAQFVIKNYSSSLDASFKVDLIQLAPTNSNCELHYGAMNQLLSLEKNH